MSYLTEQMCITPSNDRFILIEDEVNQRILSFEPKGNIYTISIGYWLNSAPEYRAVRESIYFDLETAMRAWQSRAYTPWADSEISWNLDDAYRAVFYALNDRADITETPDTQTIRNLAMDVMSLANYMQQWQTKAIMEGNELLKSHADVIVSEYVRNNQTNNAD